MAIAAASVWASVGASAVACSGRDPRSADRAAASGVPWSPDPAARSAALPRDWQRLGVGAPADSARVAAWDFDVDTLGHGLPDGRGTVADGAVLYAAKCAMCHGAKGEGMPPAFPALVGREPRGRFDFASDPTMVRTVGNYWPHATTLYDYIQRAMPYTAPGSLTPDETYALTAWVLAANEILPPDAALDAAALRRVRMPAAGKFVNDNRGSR
jgi:cytochrome c